MTFVAADQIDVCAMFEEEVDQALAEGWGFTDGSLTNAGTFITTRRASAGNAATTNGSTLYAWSVRVFNAKPDRFKTLWFDDNLDGKIKDESVKRW